MTRENLNAYIRLLGHFENMEYVFDDEIYDDESLRAVVEGSHSNDLDRKVASALLEIGSPADRFAVCDQAAHRPPQDMTDGEVIALHRIATEEGNEINARFAEIVLRERGLLTSANRVLS